LKAAEFHYTQSSQSFNSSVFLVFFISLVHFDCCPLFGEDFYPNNNTAAAAGGQAVALRVGADLTAFYRCNVEGHEAALYAHSFCQFYRE
jgi:hypothetical protein